MGLLSRATFAVTGYANLEKSQREALAEALCALFPEHELEVSWRDGFRDASPAEKAAVLRCLSGKKPVIQIGAKGGFIDLEKLPTEKLGDVLALLERHGLKAGSGDDEGPDSLLLIAVIFALSLVAVFVVYLYPAIEYRNETLANVTAVLLILTMLGGLLLVTTAGRFDELSLTRARSAMVMFLPGFLVLAPWSVLLVPLLRLRLHWNFVRATAVSRSPAES